MGTTAIALIGRSLYLLHDDSDDIFRIFFKLVKNFVLYIYWPIIFSFIFLGVWDYLRRYYIACKLNEMISIRRQSSNDNDIKRLDDINQETKKLMGQVKSFFGLRSKSSSSLFEESNRGTGLEEEEDADIGLRASLYADASIYDDDELPQDWTPNQGTKKQSNR